MRERQIMRTVQPTLCSNRATLNPIRRPRRTSVPVPPLTELKNRIQREFAVAVPGSERVLAAALREAEALAWRTGFPQLIFPVLAEEKARGVRKWHFRQQLLRRHSPTFALAE